MNLEAREDKGIQHFVDHVTITLDAVLDAGPYSKEPRPDISTRL